ncbi:P-type conjugative transfer protein TrbL, partial [Escherichia coli]|nr:P-type conjugative transfer protein TrbL [Escherichia coli]
MRLRKPGKATCAAALTILGLLLLPELASAATDTGVMNSVMDKYKEVAKGWGDKMVVYATWLFWGLALISMVWTYGLMLLRKADMGEFFAETVRFFGTLGFMWWLLLNGPKIANAVIDTLLTVGTKVVGGPSDITPSSITDIGFDLFFRTLDSTSRLKPVDSFCAIILATGVLIVLAIVAVNVLLLFVSAWILMYGGVFFLGFGGARWTSEMAISYYKSVLGIGAQLMAMVLLIGVGKSFVDQAVVGMSNGLNLKEMGVMLITAVILLYLTNRIPPMVANIVGGPGTAGIGSYGAGAAMGAAMAAAGIAAGVASAGAAIAASAAANAAGAGSALKAAFESASSAGSDGGNAGDT